MNNEIVVYNTPNTEIKPYRNDYNVTIGNQSFQLKRDTDFGMIKKKDGSNISTRPSLFKSGAEKLLLGYGLYYDVQITDTFKDYKTGFFYYECKASAYHQGQLVRCGFGCCNSNESGNGTASGFNVANSCLKKAKKRALVDLALSLASCSDMFVQDLEDTQNEERAKQIVSNEDVITAKQKKRIFAIASSNGITIEKAKELLVSWGFASTNDIKQKDYDEICEKLENYNKENN